MKHSWIAALAVLSILPSTAHAESDGTGFTTIPCEMPSTAPMPGSGAVLNANPSNAQAVLDSASEGDLVILADGVYAGNLDVNVPGIRVRGESRNGTILDGGSTREIGISAIGVDRVVIENMTAHNFIQHGFYWYHAHGYWGRHLTAYNNGLYGLYAFDSRCGQIDNSYTSGNADSGFYIGECYPCDATITDILAESNALGYSGTNAGGNLILKDSIWRNNAMGIVPNTLDGEDRPPQRGITIKENVVANNNAITAPGVSLAGTFYGVGIALAGGVGNAVYGNVVTDHALAGVITAPLPDQTLWIPSGNTVWGNTVTHDAALYPDSYDLGQNLLSGPGNCYADNTIGNSQPPMIEEIYSCGMTTTPPGGSPLIELGLIQGFAGLNGRVQSNWRTWPVPAGGLTQADAPSGALIEWLPEVSI
jgi:hypothetical protein